MIIYEIDLIAMTSQFTNTYIPMFDKSCQILIYSIRKMENDDVHSLQFKLLLKSSRQGQSVFHHLVVLMTISKLQQTGKHLNENMMQT